MADKQRLKKNHFEYYGKGGELFKIWLVNLLLTIVTLGIYSFWGKTRIRRYLAAKTALNGDPLEYTGTGKELFIGFLKFFPLLVGALALVAFVPLSAIVIYPALGFMALAGIYAGMKYKFSRLRWRSIRGNLEGSIFKYALVKLKWIFLNAISLGFLIPRSDLRLHEFVMNNLYFGDRKFRYAMDKASLKRLFKIHILTLLLCLVMVGVAFGGFALAASGNAGLGVILVMAGIIVPIIARVPYQVSLLQQKARVLTLANEYRFKITLTTKALILFRLKMFALFIVTLGVALPWIINANFRFFFSHLIIGGDLSKFEAAQALGDPDSGEGMEDVFSDDGFAMLG